MHLSTSPFLIIAISCLRTLHGCHNEVKMQACTLARQHCTVVTMRLKCKHVSFYIVLCIVCHVYNLLTITAKSSQNISYRHQNNHCQANNRWRFHTTSNECVSVLWQSAVLLLSKTYEAEHCRWIYDTCQMSTDWTHNMVDDCGQIVNTETSQLLIVIDHKDKL